MKNIISRILEIDSVLKKRKEMAHLENYNNGALVHLKQLAFHKCKKRNRWVFGGNRSGKTECGAVETVWLARGIHPYRKNKQNISCWVVSLSNQVQRDVAQNKILYYLKKEWIVETVMHEGRKSSLDNGVIDYITIKNVFGGESKIAFKSCDQGREKFQGTSLDFVWFDEEPPKDIYQECQMRVMDKKGDIFGTMTPLKGLTWVYDEIFVNKSNSKEVWYEFMEWADNPFLNKEEIELLNQTLSEEELQSRRYGRFMENGGMVYSEFEENVNVIEPFEIPLDWQDTLSIDPGLNNPTSVHWYASDYDGNVYVIAEHYESRQTVSYHSQKIKEISKKINWHCNSNGYISALIDSASNQRTLASEKSVAELFYENGILVNTSVNKDLFAGINKVKSYFKNSEGKSRLFIFKNCTNMIREIKGYYWGKGDVPTKKDDHSLDELRYYIMFKQSKSITPTPKTPIQKHKLKLIKHNEPRIII